MKKVFIDSVGCTENIVDGAIMKNVALSQGYQPASSPGEADLIILNTCAYKKHQEDLCVDAIKKYERIKKNGAEVVVTGCLVGINKEKLDEVFSGFSFPPADLLQIYTAIDVPQPDSIEEAHHIPRDISDSEMFGARALLEKIYGVKRFIKKNTNLSVLPNFNYFDYIGDEETIYVRISRGCLNSCGYCAIRFAQGKLQSAPIDSVLSIIRKGIAEGYNKVFLIGTNTSHYGKDIGSTIFELLDSVQKIDGEFKVILHNFEPFGVLEDPDSFVRLISSSKMLSLYFPIQSGSQSVLNRMNRHYDIKDVMKHVRQLKQRNADVLIRTEFIIGYPGETWNEFFETVSLCKDFKFDQIDLHCYSPRPDTQAAKLDGQVKTITKYLRLLLIHSMVFFRTTIRKLRPI